MNLQFFAEAAAEEAADEGKAAENKTDPKQEKLLTQAEVDALIEKRLARAQRDREKQLSEARAAGEKAGEARARMSEEERLRADREQAERTAGEREAQLRQREAEITKRELRADAIEKLAERGLPRELSELLDYTDQETCESSLATVEKLFRTAVQSGIDERIRKSGGSVSAGGSGAGKPDYTKMSDAEYYAAIGKK